MSLIHEALQKAEAERRSGELPPLLSMARPTEKAAPSPMRLLAWAGAILLATAVVYNNRQLILATVGMPEPAPSATEQVAEQTTAPPISARKPDVLRAPQPAQTIPDAPTESVPAPTVSVADLLGAGAREVATESTPEIVSSQQATNLPVKQVAATDQKPVPPLADLPIPALENPPEIKSEPERAPVDIVDGNAPTASDPLAELRPVPDTTTPAAAVVEAPIDAVPYIFELPLETRQLLPALKVTMHVYNADTSKRFAIIDGKRVNEGGIVGNELDIVEIQRDALLLKFRQTRFLLPRIGR